ncbi:hypothetical protein [Belnapia sp. F-4-1]|uniref:hypothetical protein n=1 Tax=Belnapia sp. F-4-1 TaxID=1545443 RepID=UPI0005BBA507|nr:hypothetical protein [Belnapia sp. F-4-1]
MPFDITSAVRVAAILPEGGPALPSRISWGAVIGGSLIAAVIAAVLGARRGTRDRTALLTPGLVRHPA